ncbi:MAG: hypothetical protein JWQ47_610, partial [Glaciihabitans sp.]|nr:hypothetical protein [Glaciihabitans sp.]
DSGALDAAKKLGISTQTLVSASLGNAAAQKAVNDALAKAKDGWDKSSSSMVNNSKAAGSVGVNSAIVSKAINTQTGEVKASMQAYNDLDIALGGTGSATKAQYDAVVALADRYGMSVTAYQNAKAAQQAASDQLKITTQNMYLQNDAGGLLQQTLDKLNGKAISAASSQNQFDSQLANMSTHLNAAGNQILRANTLLTGNTAAAVANRGELINLTSAALSNADAYRNQTDAQGNLIHSSDQTRQKLIDMRTQIINNAVAHGEDRKAVTDFVDALYQIPSSVPTVHVEADTKAATAAVKAFLNLLGSVPSSAQTGAGVLNTPGAYGLTIPKKAGGGTVNGPGSGTSDSILHWLSNGEEVTRASRASAYQPMLKAINNGTPAQISAAASNLAGPSQSKAGATIHQVINSALGQSEAEIGNIAANQLNFLFRSR